MIPRVIRGFNHCPEAFNKKLLTELIVILAQKMKTYTEGYSFKVIGQIFEQVSEVPHLELIINQESLNFMINTILQTTNTKGFQRYQTISLLRAFNNLARQRFSLTRYQTDISKMLRVHYLDANISKHCSHAIEVFEKGLLFGYFSFGGDLQSLLSHLDKHEQTWLDKDLISILKLTVITHNKEAAENKQKRLTLLQSKIHSAIKKKYKFLIIYEFLYQFSRETLEREQLKIDNPADLREIQSMVEPILSELLLPANSMRYHVVLPLLAQALVAFDPQENGEKLQTYLKGLEEASFSHIFLKMCDGLHLMSVYERDRKAPESYSKFILNSITSNLDQIVRIGFFHRIMRFISSSDRSVFNNSTGEILPEFAQLVEKMNSSEEILSNETITSIEFTTLRKFYMKLSSLGFADKPFLKELVVRIVKRSYNELDFFSLLEHFDLLLEIDLDTSRSFAKSPAVLNKMADVQKMLSAQSIASMSTLNRLMRLLLFLVEETPTREETVKEKVERNTVMWVLKGTKRPSEQKSLSKEDYLVMLKQTKEKVPRTDSDCRGPDQEV